MKKKTSFLIAGIIIFLAAISVAFFCLFKKPESPVEHQRIKVAATIFPLYDIVLEVGGDKIEPVLLLPPGSSPHTYEISLSQAKDMQTAAVLFSIGAGVDDWAKNMAGSVAGLNIVDLEHYVVLRPFEHQGTAPSEEEHGDGDVDPHYWLNPDNAMLMAGAVAAELAAIDPDNTDYYRSRAEDFSAKLQTKEKEWQDKVGQLGKKDLVVFHDAWGYFADHFGFRIAATFEPFPGQLPSPQYLISLQKQIEADEITSLFVEPQLSKESITTLADDLRVKVDTLDPLGGVEGRESYISLLDFNINNIYQALK